MPLYLDYLYNFRGAEERLFARKSVKILVGVICCLLWLSIGTMRVLTGVHSWVQVAQGWLLGLFISFYMNYCVRAMYCRHITKLTMQEDVVEQSLMSKVILAQVGILIFTFVTYTLVKKTEVSEEWIENLKAHGC
jgi:hypothetical protein